MNKPLARMTLPLLLGFPLAALADVPKVAVDISPVHSLVSKVMGELGEPALFMQQGASPHGYSLRPSEAQTLDNAELVVWVSDDLTPWLSSPLASMASDAEHLELMALEETQALNYRDRSVALMDTHDGHDDHGHDDHGHDDHGHDDHGHDDHGHDDHGHDDHGHDDHGHDDHGHDDHGHDDHGHDDHGHDDHGHDDHGHDDHGHDDHGHNHEGQDPHGWLDPENARLWLDAIARRLSTLDPENAEQYQTNATQAKADLLVLQSELEQQLTAQPAPRFVVFHDAYQYFEHRFEVPSEGAISLGDASEPSPARIEALQRHVRENAIQCVFSEPQFNSAMVENVFGDTPAVMGVIDPLGVELPLGPALYDELLRQLAGALEECSAQQG